MAVDVKLLGFIQDLRLYNFLLYKDVTVQIPNGITILTGKNGTGKSLFLDALRLALGLKSRTIRMERLTHYLRDKEKDAIVEITLRNPFPLDSEVRGNRGNRILNTKDPSFDAIFLRDVIVKIRRRIHPNGTSSYQMFNSKREKFEKIKATQKNLLMEALSQVGIIANDELVFVPAEDFLGFINDTPENRYKIFMEKLGLNKSEENYNEVLTDLREKKDERFEIENKINQRKQESSELDQIHKDWKEKQDKKKNLTQMETKREWLELIELQKKRDSIERNIDLNEKKLLDSKKEAKKREKIIEEIKAEELEPVNLNYEKIEKKFNEGKAFQNQLKGSSSTLTMDEQKTNQELTKFKSKKKIISSEIETLEQRVSDIKKNAEDTDFHKYYDDQLKKLEDQKEIFEKNKGKIDDQIENREKELDDEYEKQRQEIERELKYLKKQLIELISKQDGKRKGNKPSRMDSVINNLNIFSNEIKKNKLDRSVIGPVYRLLDVEGHNSKWRQAISQSLKGILFDFIALDTESYSKLNEIRKSSTQFKGINIGYLNKDNLPERLYKIDGKIKTIRKESGYDVDFVYRKLIGEQDAIYYARLFSGGDHVLVDETDSKKVKDLTTKYRFSFMRIDRHLHTGRSGSDRSAGASKLPVLIGFQKEENIPETIKQINIKIKEKEQEQHSIMKGKSEIKKNDNKFIELQEKKSKIDQKIGGINTKINDLEEERENKDPNKIIQRCNSDIKDKKKELEKIYVSIQLNKERLENLLGQLREQDQQIADFDKKFKIIEKEIQKSKEERNVILKKLDTEIAEYKIINRESSSIEANLKKSQNNLNSEMNNLDELQKKFEGMKRPKEIPERMILMDRINRIKKEIAKIKVPEDHEQNYKKFKAFEEDLENKKEEYSNAIDKLEKEGKNWKEKIRTTIDDKVKDVNFVFKEILNSIGADGGIKIEKDEDHMKPSLTLYTQFGRELPRSIDQHSSGQKQAGIIALVLALQSQSITPITAIDEFDRGLDPVSKRNLIKMIPDMISRALELKGGALKGLFNPQFILVAPDIAMKDLSEGINYLTCVMAQDSTNIKS